MKLKQNLDSSRYCPDSCESLYGGKCIIRIDGVYNGGLFLYYEQIKLGRRYIRRQDCPMIKLEVEK